MTITYMREAHADEQTLSCLHPLVREWFTKKYPGLSPPQRYSIKNIHDGVNTLISSPTGSGKTLSAFLSILNRLITLDDNDELEDQVYCVYVSPLKALANDITKNLKEPLKELKALAKEELGKTLHVRVATRTGDTSPSQKQRMLSKPPHILITTPESLAITLTTIKFRELLRPAEFAIIDEIHALAENKRGVHLSLSLERLEELVTEKREQGLVRIGLSATVSPLEEVAKFLVGLELPNTSVYRPCQIVDVQGFKRLDLKVLTPVPDIMRSSHQEMNAALYALLHDLIQRHQTTLVFTNTRAATERVVHHLKERYPTYYTGILDGDVEEETLEAETEAEIAKEEGGKGEVVTVKRRGGFIGAHHGSLSKTHRFNIENRLKKGELKAVVCSTSLELGIDIGSIDLVVLLGSPKSVARGLQRIGRSGHQLDEKAKGRIIVLDRDDMVECSVLLKAAIERKIDRLRIPHNALDVLAQQLFGMAIEKVRSKEEVYWIVRRSYNYHDLSRESFDKVIDYLSGAYVSLEERSVYAKIWYDRETGMVGKRGRLARVLALTNIGTIPDETSVKVKLGEYVIGTIDEAFLERLSPGDVFVLGGETYEFRNAQGLTARVRVSAGRPPTVPRWASEMLPLSYDLGLEIQRFRRYVDELLTMGKEKKDIIQYLDEYLYADERTLNSLYEYFREQHAYASVPHEKRLLVEHFREGSKRYAIVHSVYGRRVNDVLSRALALVLGRIHHRDVAVTITDNGFSLQATTPLHVRRAFNALKPEELPLVMKQALEKTEVLARRFRHCATRSLMILRKYKGASKSVGKQQMNSRLLLSAVRRLDDDFPILSEARREVLEDLMDLPNAQRVLEDVSKDKIKIEEVTTTLPSPFAFKTIMQSYTDILKIEEKQEFLKRMHELILSEINARGHAEKETARATARKEKRERFSYEEVWREAEERRLAERDDELEALKRETWNLPRVPVYAKRELVKLLDGQKNIREDVEERVLQYKEEIQKTWPPLLVKRVFDQLGIGYDEAALKANEHTALLRRQFKKAATKLQLEPHITYHADKLLDGGVVDDKEFWDFVKEVLSGTIPKAWDDEIIKYLREQLVHK